MTVSNIYITYEKGLEALAPYIKEAVSEMMDCFPEYKEYFPVTNLGDWKSDKARTVRNGQIVLNPYESIQWYIERAKIKAREQGRWPSRGQISIDRLYDDLASDPYAQKIPQMSLLVTKHDLYGTGPDGRLLNFCNGVTKEGAFAIVSTARFLDNNGVLDVKRFQAVLMHEFGHLIGLTSNSRTDLYNQLGPHCPNGDLMEQDMSGTGYKIKENLENRKRQGKKPICDQCIMAGRRFFQKLVEKCLSAHHRSAGQTRP